MAGILYMTLHFSGKKIVIFWFKCHWNSLHKSPININSVLVKVDWVFFFKMLFYCLMLFTKTVIVLHDTGPIQWLFSQLWILMAWCFSTRASIATTVLSIHPLVSRCLWVNDELLHWCLWQYHDNNNNILIHQVFGMHYHFLIIISPVSEGSGDVMVLRRSRPPPAMVLTR